MDCVPGYCYIEFNDYSEKNHPAFIVGIERDTNSMVLTVYKGPVQKDNVQKNHKLERKESFGKYSKDSLSLALEYYYENICGIIDV